MEDFTWTSTDSVLWASSAHPPSVAFLAALSQKLAPEAHVYLQCCFSGMDGTAGSLVKRVATAIAKPTNKRVLVSGYTTDLLYHGITNGKNSRVLGYGTSLPNQTVTPLSEIPGFVTNKPGMAPHDAVMEALVPGP